MFTSRAFIIYDLLQLISAPAARHELSFFGGPGLVDVSFDLLMKRAHIIDEWRNIRYRPEEGQGNGTAKGFKLPWFLS